MASCLRSVAGSAPARPAPRSRAPTAAAQRRMRSRGQGSRTAGTDPPRCGAAPIRGVPRARRLHGPLSTWDSKGHAQCARPRTRAARRADSRSAPQGAYPVRHGRSGQQPRRLPRRELHHSGLLRHLRPPGAARSDPRSGWRHRPGAADATAVLGVRVACDIRCASSIPGPAGFATVRRLRSCHRPASTRDGLPPVLGLTRSAGGPQRMTVGPWPVRRPPGSGRTMPTVA